MKLHAILFMTLFSISAGAVTSVKMKNEKATCAKLIQQADEECVELMCGELIEYNYFANNSECMDGPDYAEAAQITCEDTLPEAIRKYNKAHPKLKVFCEE